MRIAVLSDIHANLPALDAVLADAGPMDAVWHLGDVVGYGPDPNGVVERLHGVGAIGVRGNHDSAAIGGPEIDDFNPEARAAMEWTRGEIGAATRDWLAAQPLRREEQGLTLVHGSPRDPTWEYILSASIARANLSAFETPYCLHGHTHVPIVFRAAAQGPAAGMQTLGPQSGAVLSLDERRALLNPGSVGQPRDGIPDSSYLVLDLAAREASWHRVAYDIGAVQAAMRQARLPRALIERLSLGL
jgi:predicted phosphodiesterase